MKVSKRLLTGLVASLGIAVSMAGVPQAQQRPNQGGADSAQRASVQNTETAALAVPASSGFQACASNEIALHNGAAILTGTIATVALD